MVILGIGGLGLRDAAAALLVTAHRGGRVGGPFHRVKHQAAAAAGGGLVPRLGGGRRAGGGPRGRRHNPWIRSGEGLAGTGRVSSTAPSSRFHIFHDETRESLLYLKENGGPPPRDPGA